MRRRYLSLLLALLAFLLLENAQAVVVPNMNTTDVPVADHSQPALQQALQQALNQVLIKISGNTGVPTLPAVQNAQPKLTDLVESYGYSTQADSTGNTPLMLHVVFNQGAVRQLLKNAGQAIWDNDRPLTLLWISTPQGVQNGVMSSGDTSPLITSIQQFAKQRGIPVLFPAMDLEDQADVAVSASQLPSNDQLSSAAQRYEVKSILAGSVANEGGQFTGEWELVLNGTPYEWQTSGESVAQAVTNGIDRAADMMANQLATVDSKGLQSTIIMEVSGIQNLDDYVHVVAKLRHLAPVSTVVVNDMSSDTLLLKISAVGGVNGLMDAIKNIQNLKLQSAPAEAGPNQANLFYSWQNAQPVADTVSSNQGNNP